MEKNTENKMKWYKRKGWRNTIISLAAVVVFATTYALILPASTITEDVAAEDPAIFLEQTAPAEEGTVEGVTVEVVSAPVEGEGDPVVPVEGEGDPAAPVEGEGDPAAPVEGEGDPAAPVEGEGDPAAPVEGEGDPTAPAEGDPVAPAEPEATPDPMPARLFEMQIGDLIVKVEAPQGAFPTGARMHLEWVEDQNTLNAIENAVDEGVKVKTVKAVDITFLDADGNEIEPLKPIHVSMRDALVEQAENIEVVHVDDQGEAEVVEQKDEVTKADEVTFERDQFSVYALVETETIIVPFVAGDGSTYEVTVSFGESAGVPSGAKLTVSEVTEDSELYESYVRQAASAIETNVSDLSYIKLLDIKILDENDQPVVLESPVDVQIKLMDMIQADDTKQVVHFEGEAETPVVMQSDVSGDVVAFATDGFSVYAVVGDGSTEEEARVTVNFYGKDTTAPVATVFVKNSDTAEELLDIVYDPGCGELDSTKKELFDGWVISTKNTTDGSSYTLATEGKTIEEVRAYLETLEIEEGDVVNIYAKIVRTITVSYQGEVENILLGTVNIKVLGSDNPDSEDNIGVYTVNMNYTPATSTQAFMGWNIASGAANIISAQYNGADVEPQEDGTILYQNGTVLTLKGDVTLSVNAPSGHWLVFDENGKGATYNAPRFIEDGDRTAAPSLEMVRLGYDFGGWYKVRDGKDISDATKTADGKYYVITDDVFEPYSFNEELSDHLTVYAKWDAATSANYTVIVWRERMSDTYAENGGTGEGKTKNYDFWESYTFSGPVSDHDYANAVSNGTSSVVDGDDAGTRYYNAHIQGRDVNGTNVNRTVAEHGYHCAGFDTNVLIAPEGTSVVNVYYDRNTVTYTFYTYGQGSGGTWWLCKENGDRIIESGRNATSSTEIATRSGDNYSQYTGRVAHDDGRTYYYSTTGFCGGTDMREAHWEYISNSGNQWNVYQKSTGLYGEPLNWPTDTSIWWYEGHNNTQGTGTRMTYKDAFLPLDDDMTVEYWGNTSSSNGRIHFYTQDVVGGNNYTEQVAVAAGNANFSINDKFTGFYAVQYRADNGAWQNVGAYNESTGIYGSPVSFNSRLDIRYNRIKASITFLDGAYFDGDGNPTDETPQAAEFRTTDEYFYEASVSSFNKGGGDYYTPPAKTGYTFAGWYADDACTVPYTFSTMPATGITVYAKWIQNQYRVFLHPNVPETDTTLSWGSEDQDMNFRVSSGNKVSAPTGTRAEYRFIGWYLDEACTQVFDADRFVLNDTTVTTPYDKTVDMTDPMNKYGNIEGTGSNSDLTGYNGGERFWITRKLDLYAKWRAELIGADGIGVRYDANGGSGAPSDLTLYLDNTDTVAQGATTPPDDTQQFLYWVLQRWDETQNKFVDVEGADNKYYPGDTFTVLKANALIEEKEGSTPDDPKYSYTVQLRAEYGPKDEPTPTHLTWYANGGVAADGTTTQYTDPSLQINEAVDIHPANTFTRPGYQFIGWARVDSTTEGYELAPKDLDEDDLFLKFVDGKFYAQDDEGNFTVEVTQVAADERDPYHDIYAVWELKTYTVTVVKVVNGIDGDDLIPFSFQQSGLTTDTISTFSLVGNENGAEIEGSHVDHAKEFTGVKFGTEFTLTEQADDAFEVSLSYVVSDADNAEDNKTVTVLSNEAEIEVRGNIVVTVTNTRKAQLVRILKTSMNGNAPLAGAKFTVTVGDTTYTLISDEDGYLKNETFADGILPVPHGTYSLTETAAPDGYYPLSGDVTILVNAEGISAGSYQVTEPTATEPYYIITIPNNPGVALPRTGGIGVNALYLAGICLLLLGGTMLLVKKEYKKTRKEFMS